MLESNIVKVFVWFLFRWRFNFVGRTAMTSTRPRKKIPINKKERKKARRGKRNKARTEEIRRKERKKERKKKKKTKKRKKEENKEISH